MSTLAEQALDSPLLTMGQSSVEQWLKELDASQPAGPARAEWARRWAAVVQNSHAWPRQPFPASPGGFLDNQAHWLTTVTQHWLAWGADVWPRHASDNAWLWALVWAGKPADEALATVLASDPARDWSAGLLPATMGTALRKQAPRSVLSKIGAALPGPHTTIEYLVSCRMPQSLQAYLASGPDLHQVDPGVWGMVHDVRIAEILAPAFPPHDDMPAMLGKNKMSAQDRQAMITWWTQRHQQPHLSWDDMLSQWSHPASWRSGLRELQRAHSTPPDGWGRRLLLEMAASHGRRDKAVKALTALAHHHAMVWTPAEHVVIKAIEQGPMTTTCVAEFASGRLATSNPEREITIRELPAAIEALCAGDRDLLKGCRTWMSDWSEELWYSNRVPSKAEAWAVVQAPSSPIRILDQWLAWTSRGVLGNHPWAEELSLRRRFTDSPGPITQTLAQKKRTSMHHMLQGPLALSWLSQMLNAPLPNPMDDALVCVVTSLAQRTIPLDEHDWVKWDKRVRERVAANYQSVVADSTRDQLLALPSLVCKQALDMVVPAAATPRAVPRVRV